MNPVQAAMQQQSTFNERFQKALESASFPADTLPQAWFDAAFCALHHASIIGLGINPNDWQGLLTALDKKEMSLYQFALLSNNLQTRTPTELCLDLNEYHTIMSIADEYVVKWQELTDGIRAEIEASLEEEAKMRQAAAQWPKANDMKAVKSDA